jgi:molecular chaperone DnaK
MTKMIEANTTIPTKKSETYTTAADSQSSVEIHILQGERTMAKDNRTIGRFILDGIPPAPRGVPQVEVSLDIDANGILNVHAKDKGTGKEQHIRIEASTGLSKEEVEKMKNDAKANEATDKEARDKADKLNTADSMIFSTEKQLKEYGDKIPAEKKTVIEKSLEELKTAHKDQNFAGIETALTALNAAWQAASEDMYKATQGQPGQPGAEGAQQGAPGEGNTPPTDSNVKDAEYEDVSDDKKGK